MTRGALFMCFGGKHNAHQFVAVNSLRKHFAGPIAILIDEQNRDSMQRIADVEPDVELIEFDRFKKTEYGQGSAYLNKTRLIDMMPFGKAAFLDCDTLTVGSIDNIFPADIEVRLTRFVDWVTTGRKMRKRIERWREVEPKRVAVQLVHDYPAINTGVMGLSKLSKRLSKEWQRVCKKNVSFICDEIAMQLVFLDYPHVVLPDYYNASPIYSEQREGFELHKVRVWHGHGQKSIRSPGGLVRWLPELLEVAGKYSDFLDEMGKNKYFRRLANNPIEFVQQYGRQRAEKLIDENRLTESSFK